MLRVLRTKRHSTREEKRKKKLSRYYSVVSGYKRRYENDRPLLRKLFRYLRRFSSYGKPIIPLYRRDEETIQLPEVFDMHENPTESLRSVSAVCYHLLNHRTKSLSINHDTVDRIGYSAEALLSIVTSGCIDNIKSKEKTVPELRGTYAESSHVQKMMNKAGIVIATGSRSHMQTDQTEAEYFVRRSYFRQDSMDRDTGTDEKTLACRNMQKHVNNSLSRAALKLTPTAEVQLGVYLGEIIGNAEDHSDERLWCVTGYYDPVSHKCEIVVFNFGTTFYETFRNLPKEHFSRAKTIQPYIDAHINSGFSESELTTIAALQSNVSSKNCNEDDTRGSGTIDFIEFFQDISSEINALDNFRAQMSILSGDVQLLFDKSVKISLDSRGRQIVAFNSENDLRKAPERKYVRALRGMKFPGTIISIEFLIRPGSDLVNEEESNDEH